MSGTWDANIKLLSAVDNGKDFAIDNVVKGSPFDVLANVEVGKNIMGFANKYTLFIAVRNLSKSTTLVTTKVEKPVTPVAAPWNAELRVDINGGWLADEGDILDVVASFKFTAGVNEDYSSAQSMPFVVSAA